MEHRLRANDIVDFVWRIAPNPDFGVENAFELGDGETEVRGIGVPWWIDGEMLDDFVRRGLTLGLTHERVLYDLPAAYPWGEIPPAAALRPNRRIPELCRRHGIAVHRFHSNIDLAAWGMPRALMDQLGWSGYPIDWSRRVPVVEHPPVTLGALIDEVKAKLRLPFVRYDGDPARTVRRIAAAWGGLGQQWRGAACATPLGFDVLLSGDVIDGVVRLAREEGWAVVDAFHHATELAAMRRLADKVRTHFPSGPVWYYENTMPWAVR